MICIEGKNKNFVVESDNFEILRPNKINIEYV
jgi:hypothetical protein